MDCIFYLPIYCISISHKNTDVDIRKRFSFFKEENIAFLKKIVGKKVCGAVLVATCNRTELYFSSENNSVSSLMTEIEELFATEKNQDVSVLREYSFSFFGENAIKHLFNVASGLESMVLGENEILGQIRDCYKLSCENSLVDFYMNYVFQKALSCAKRVKTQTNLSKTTESIATLAVKEIMKETENMKVKNVLVVGASGQTGGLVVRDLVERENIHVYATVRKRYNLPDFEAVSKINYDDRYNYVDECDVIVSATKSPHYTIFYNDVKENIKSCKKRLFIDLAVPNDIDPKISDIDGVSLKNIDDFTKIAQSHNEQKKIGARKAECIIAEEVDNACKDLMFHSQIDFVSSLKEHLENKNGMQFFYELKNTASCIELNNLISVCKKVLEK